MRRLLVVALMLGWAAVQAQVAARWDTTEQVVGGMVVLEAEFAHEDEVVRPDTVSALVWLREEVDSTGENIVYRWTALAVDTGEVHFESWAVEPLVIGFLPALEGLEKEQSRAPIDVPFSLWWWILAYKWWLLAGALALAGAWYLWRNWTLKTKGFPEGEIPDEKIPEEDMFKVAMQTLETMRLQRPWEKDVKQYYIDLGDLVRRYLSGRSGLPLSEITSQEALELVKMIWTDSQREDYFFIISRADMVKFAKGSMDVKTHLDCLAKAEALIIEFKPEAYGE